MTRVITFILGIFFLFLSFSFFYKPNWIIRVNTFFRNQVFNDYFILQSRKLRAIIYLIIGLILVYWAL